MLPASSLSRAAHGLRDLLMKHIDEFDNIDRIKIGHPGDTIKDLEDLAENCLNLFFYDVNYDGYPSDGRASGGQASPIGPTFWLGDGNCCRA